MAVGERKVLVQFGLGGAGAPGTVGVDRQVPGDGIQPGLRAAVPDVQVVAVGPGPQHGFLHEVLGATAVTPCQCGGQP
jgi:hypothetical protein